MKNTKLFKVCLTGLMAAIIALFTAFVKIPTGINDGYLHFGDSVIYIAGCIVGPFGIISSAIGGALADVLAGAAVWALPTAIIKAFNCLPFVLATRYYMKKKGCFRIVNIYTVAMTVLSAFITVFGYLLAESLMYSFPTALTSVPFSIAQAVGSGIIFVLMGKALEKAKIERLIGR